MHSFRFTHFLLVALGITNAWLLSHPNLIGRAGILFYRYDYLRTFPRALLTVGIVMGGSVLLIEAIKRWASPRLAATLFAVATVLSVGTLLYVWLTFSSGLHRYTGKAFIWGAYLLPLQLIGLFSQGLYSVFRSGKLN
jgi:hypothetical protein